MGKSVVVIGGGNTAIDAARTAVRLGAKEVTIMYRRTREQMPASEEEIDGALAEDVKVEFLAAPVKIEEEGGVCQLICQRMKLGNKKDASGRLQPVPVVGSEFTVTYDTVIVAAGQAADAAALGLSVGAGGRVAVNPDTLATAKAGVFAAGDAVTGPASIIAAVAQGRQAAKAIDKYLGGRGVICETLVPDEAAALLEAAPRGNLRPVVPTAPLGERLHGFAAVEQGYDAYTASKEARRCLACDLRNFKVEVDDRACKECGYCQEACGLGVFDKAGFFNDKGYKPVVAAHPEKCVGCLQCFFVCPDFAITVEKEC